MLICNQCKPDSISMAFQCICNTFWYFRYISQHTRWRHRPLLVGCYCCQCICNTFWNFRLFYNTLDGTLGLLLVSWSCCCCCWTGYEQLKPLEVMQVRVTQTDIKNATLQHSLTPSTLIISCRWRDSIPRYLLKLNQESCALAHGATTTKLNPTSC